MAEVSKTAFLVFPHHLFEAVSPLKSVKQVVVVEEFLFFNLYKFHKAKIAFHRATLRSYADYLRHLGFEVWYIAAHEEEADVRLLIEKLAVDGYQELFSYHPTDCWLEKRIRTAALKTALQLTFYDPPSFLTSVSQTEAYFVAQKSFSQTQYYISQRKQTGILIDALGKPEGGQWTYDADNRKKYPKNKIPPRLSWHAQSEYYEEAFGYVEYYYADNPGRLPHDFLLPVTHKEAKKWLDDFLQNRFQEFGEYEDAIVISALVLHHSVLSPLLNIGLLLPGDVLKKALTHAAAHQIPMNSLEGFLRQIMGWREFIRGVYLVAGVKQRTSNFWKFKRKMPPSFYTGTTGIKPVDDAIRKLLKTGYVHHIERLMLLSNFMLLCEICPDDVYQWFMELSIDSYDWVMVPNVYGMGQFADGGMMCSKPYISGSNYILKMSDYTKEESWIKIWDALFWRFMHVHRDFFLTNPRLGMLVKSFDKMEEEKRKSHLHTATVFLNSL